MDKNDEGMLNPEAHLTCYEIKKDDDDDDGKMEILVDNQFSEQVVLEVEKPEYLCAPSEKLEVRHTVPRS